MSLSWQRKIFPIVQDFFEAIVTMKKEKSYGIVPVYQKGNEYQYLLIKARYWSFPKGHQEKEETEKDAAIRELEEEVGIHSVQLVDDFSYTISFIFRQKQEKVFKLVKYFIGITDTQSIIPQEGEVEDALWVSYEEAMEKITFKQSKRLLIAVHKYLQKMTNK